MPAAAHERDPAVPRRHGRPTEPRAAHRRRHDSGMDALARPVSLGTPWLRASHGQHRPTRDPQQTSPARNLPLTQRAGEPVSEPRAPCRARSFVARARRRPGSGARRSAVRHASRVRGPRGRARAQIRRRGNAAAFASTHAHFACGSKELKPPCRSAATITRRTKEEQWPAGRWKMSF